MRVGWETGVNSGPEPRTTGLGSDREGPSCFSCSFCFFPRQPSFPFPGQTIFVHGEHMVVSSALGGNPTETKCLPKVIVDPWWAGIFWSPQRFRECCGIEGTFKVDTALGARGPCLPPGGGELGLVGAQRSESTAGIPKTPGLESEKCK